MYPKEIMTINDLQKVVKDMVKGRAEARVELVGDGADPVVILERAGHTAGHQVVSLHRLDRQRRQLSYLQNRL